MTTESTPLRVKAVSQKRQLSSPEELLDSKKNRLVNEDSLEEISEESSDISDLSIMASSTTTTSDPGSVITLKEADLKTIAG